MADEQISLNIESNPEHLLWLRAALRGLGAEADMAEAAIRVVELCVAEAVNNCIEHAYGNQPGNEIRVDWARGDGCVELRVCDRGKRLDPESLLRVDRAMLEIQPSDRESLRPRGRGLALIKALMTEVSYESDGSCNRFCMKLALVD